MNITLNGERTTLSDSPTIAQLLAQLGYENKRLAVELNGDIVPKSEHDSTLIKEGDALEIVIAVGGG